MKQLTDNIDYDDLKQMVKDHTAGTSNRPRFIPGQGSEAQACKDFEIEIYGELVQQHDRVCLFVQSKAGELVRRLGTVQRPYLADVSSQLQLHWKRPRTGWHNASHDPTTRNHLLGALRDSRSWRMALLGIWSLQR